MNALQIQIELNPASFVRMTCGVEGVSVLLIGCIALGLLEDFPCYMYSYNALYSQGSKALPEEA